MIRAKFLLTIFSLFLFLGHSRSETFNIANGDVAGLIAAMEKANKNNQDDIINLATNGLYVFTNYYLANFTDPSSKTLQGPIALPVVEFETKLTINGNGATLRRSSTAPLFRILYVNLKAELTLRNVIIENAKTNFRGAGIYISNKTRLEVTGSKFINNETNVAPNRGGGAINVSTGSEAIIKDCEFRDNKATTSSGGAIMSVLSLITIENCKFINNISIQGNSNLAASGGAIYIDGSRTQSGYANIRNCVFDGNEARVGGAVYLYLYNSHTSDIQNCTFKNNKAVGDGKSRGGAFAVGISVYSNTDPVYPQVAGPVTAKVKITNTAIYNNTSAYLGGGASIEQWEGFAEFTNCTIANNRAVYSTGLGGQGGALHTADIDLTLTHCTIAGNYAGNSSGGIGYGTSPSKVKLYNCIIANNIANNNGSGGTTKSKDNCGRTFQGSNNIEFPAPRATDSDPYCVSNITVIDPKLGPLQDNGGSTWTMALLVGSPAINAALSSKTTGSDQRGVIRSGSSDMGAYEYNPGTGGPSPDTEAPFAPTLSLVSKTHESVNLSWTESNDNIGVVAYEIFQNSTLVATTSSTSRSITGLTPNTSYDFTIKAKDAAGNLSVNSNLINVTTNSSGSTTSNRIEAETNYSIRAEIAYTAISVQSNTGFSGGQEVRLPDNGDKIRINFSVSQAGRYILKAQVRSGNTTSPTLFWPNGYAFVIDGQTVTFTGNPSTVQVITGFTNNGYQAGLMESGERQLTTGNHYLEIETKRVYGGVDYLEVEYLGSIDGPGSGSLTEYVESSQGEAKNIKQSKLLLYPNPVNNGDIHLKIEDTTNKTENMSNEISMRVFNTRGEIILDYNGSLENAERMLSERARNLSGGMYGVNIARNGKAYQTKFWKQQ